MIKAINEDYIESSEKVNFEERNQLLGSIINVDNHIGVSYTKEISFLLSQKNNIHPIDSTTIYMHIWPLTLDVGNEYRTTYGNK